MAARVKSRSQRVAEAMRERRGDIGGWTDQELHDLYIEFGLVHPGGNQMHQRKAGAWSYLVRRSDGRSYLTPAALTYLNRMA